MRDTEKGGLGQRKRKREQLPHHERQVVALSCHVSGQDLVRKTCLQESEGWQSSRGAREEDNECISLQPPQRCRVEEEPHSVRRRGGAPTKAEQGPRGKEECVQQAGPKARDAGWRVLLGVHSTKQDDEARNKCSCCGWAESEAR